MRRQIRVRGDQKAEFDLTRLAHALLKAAREASKDEHPTTEPKEEARRED